MLGIKTSLLSCALLLSLIGNAQIKIYDKGSKFQYGIAKVENQGKIFYIDTAGKYLFDQLIVKFGYLRPENADTLSPTNMPYLDTYCKVTKGDKQGIWLNSGKWLLEPIYSDIENNDDVPHWNVKKNKKMSLFRKNGFVLPFLYDEVYEMKGNYIQVRNADKWGIYDSKLAKVIIPLQYEDIDYCYSCESHGDYFFAEKNGKWGVVDFNGKTLLPFEYDHKHENMRSDEWIYSLFKNGKRLIVNLKSGSVETAKENAATSDESFPNGFYNVKENTKYGFFNKSGKQILGTKYAHIKYGTKESENDLPDNYIGVNEDGKFGIADTTGKVIVPAIYSQWFSYRKNLGLFQSIKDNNILFLDERGNEVISPIYDEVQEEDLSKYQKKLPIVMILKKGTLTGFYNPNTKVVVSPDYDQINFYSLSDSDDYIVVQKDGKQGLIDFNGKIKLPILYNDVRKDDNGLYQIKLEDKYGLYNSQLQKWIFEPSYVRLERIPNGFYVVYTEDRSFFETSEGLINKDGEVILSPKPNQRIDALDSTCRNVIISTINSNGKKTYSLLDILTKENNPLPFDSLYPKSIENKIVVISNGGPALYDFVTKKIIWKEEPKASQISRIIPDKNIFLVIKEGKMNALSPNGKFLFDKYYDYIQPLDKNKFIVANKIASSKPKVNIITDSNNNRIEETNDIDLKYGVVDTNKGILIPMDYTFNTALHRALFRDIKENELIPLLKKNENTDKWLIGYANLDGKIIVESKYQNILRDTENKYFLVEINKKFGIVDYTGNTVLAPIYKDILLSHPPIYPQEITIGFPVLVTKDASFDMYNQQGKRIPVSFKQMIPFDSED